MNNHGFCDNLSSCTRSAETLTSLSLSLSLPGDLRSHHGRPTYWPSFPRLWGWVRFTTLLLRVRFRSETRLVPGLRLEDGWLAPTVICGDLSFLSDSDASHQWLKIH